MEAFTFDVLSDLIGTPVTIADSQGNQAELLISEVNKSQLDNDEWEAFSVIYSAPDNITIPQGIYALTHQAFPNLELFVSPKSKTEYETVITRKRQHAVAS